MGFHTGRATFLRYRVDGPLPLPFGPEHLEHLTNHAIGKQRTENKEGTEVGWIAGDDILDLGFDLPKNVIADSLHFALRIDTRKLPADLLRAYTRTELQALAAENPSGRPSARQKREAREAAREKLEGEAKDGRFIRRKAFPMLWDGLSNTLLAGTTSASALDHLQKRFQESFGNSLVLMDAGHQAEHGSHGHRLGDLRRTTFVAGNGSTDVAWVSDPSSHNYLGNEFLLWLWFVLEVESDTLVLADQSEVTVMLTRTLMLDCPRAQSGNETIRSEAPTKLPEARRAIQAGKLPRQAGLTLVRHDQQYELTLQAELLAVNGAKLPTIDENDNRLRLEERIGQLRHFIETLDLLYDTFLKQRLSAEWSRAQEQIQRWFPQEKRGHLAEAG